MDDDYNDHQTTEVSTWLGIVARDRSGNSPEILVFIPELSPVRVGSIAATASVNNITIDDIDGLPTNTAKSITTNAITAVWWGDSNRKYPPDVVEGEQVVVKKFAGADRYYWEAIGRDGRLRTLETLRVEISDDRQRAKILTDDNTFFIEMDTRNGKHIVMQTAKSDGEKFRYILKLDAKTGTVRLGDDVGNEVFIDSEKSHALLRNTGGSLLSLLDKDISVIAPQDLLMKAGRQCLISTPVITIGNTSGDGVTSFNTTAMAMNVTESFTINSKNIGFNGISTKIGGMLVATEIRSGKFMIGAAGGGYAPASTDLGEGTGSVPTQVSDVTPGTDIMNIFKLA